VKLDPPSVVVGFPGRSCYGGTVQQVKWAVVIAAVGLALCLAVAVPRAGGGQVPCIDVIRLVNQQIGRVHGGNPDLSRIAHKLKSSPAWVEHCMLAYGRRPKRPGRESAEVLEERFERMEEEEPEEASAEDAEAPDAPQYERRPRMLRLKPTPTPRGTGLGGEAP